MKSFWRTSFGLVLALAMFAGTAKAEAKADTSLDNEVEYYLDNNSGAAGDAGGLQWSFDNGMRANSGDGNTKISIGGRAMFDMTFADSDDNIDPAAGENYIGFRRARFYMSGTIYRNTLFKVQIDFANGEVEMRDIYIGLANVGGGKLLVGQMKEPFSLNELTSSKYITFTERAASVQAFAPAYNAGFGWFGNFLEGDRLYAAGGSFFNTDAQARGNGQGGWGITGRVGYIALENEDKGMMLWVAISFRWSNYGISDEGAGQVSYSARPQSFGPAFIDTGALDVDDDLRLAFEVAFAMKSFHVQAEFFMVDASAAAGDDPSFTGFYVQGGWFITGEARHFSKSSGSWSRVKPMANFWTGDGGKGAMEVAVRFDTTDLTDGGVTGGEMDTISIGFNWYWNNNTRMMVNYVMADVTDGAVGDGELSMVILRWQVDF